MPWLFSPNRLKSLSYRRPRLRVRRDVAFQSSWKYKPSILPSGLVVNSGLPTLADIEVISPGVAKPCGYSPGFPRMTDGSLLKSTSRVELDSKYPPKNGSNKKSTPVLKVWLPQLLETSSL